MKRMMFDQRFIPKLLDGSKTQTRRPINPQPIPHRHVMINHDVYHTFEWESKHYASEQHLKKELVRHSPHKPGDVVWVPEEWRPWAWSEGESIIIEFKDGSKLECLDENPDWETDLWISITDELEQKGFTVDEQEYYGADAQNALDWKMPDSLPRWASRITLEIKNIRVERIQDISHKDLHREGVYAMPFNGQTKHRKHDKLCTGVLEKDGMIKQQALDIFADFWDSVYGDGAWDRNDWVFVYGFERVRR